MSHSVFRDLDEVDTSGSRADVADNNIIVFINKDGDVQVDPNALQDLIGELKRVFFCWSFFPLSLKYVLFVSVSAIERGEKVNTIDFCDQATRLNFLIILSMILIFLIFPF